MEFRERERWAPPRRRLPTKVFATFAIFSISRDFSTTRRSARRAEKWKRVCVLRVCWTPLCDSVLMTLPRILGKSSDVMKVLVARAQSSLFRESASTRRPFFPSTITFPSLMGRIVRRCIATGAANASRYLGDGYFRPTSVLIDDLRVSKGTEKAENSTYETAHPRVYRDPFFKAHLPSSLLHILLFIFFFFLWISAVTYLLRKRALRSAQKVSRDIHDWYLKVSRRDCNEVSRAKQSGSRERDNLFVGANKSVALNQPERGENFINLRTKRRFGGGGEKNPAARPKAGLLKIERQMKSGNPIVK